MDFPSYKVIGINPKTNRKNTVHNICAIDDNHLIDIMTNEHGLVAPFTIFPNDVAPPSTAQLKYATKLGIPLPMNVSFSTIDRLISYAVDDGVDFKEGYGITQPITGEGWKKWPQEIHMYQVQQDRQIKAHSSQYIPVRLSRENKLGIFKPTERYVDYLTSLEDCQCPDFLIRGMPCKHMYRLAHELNEHKLINQITPSNDNYPEVNVNKNNNSLISGDVERNMNNPIIKFIFWAKGVFKDIKEVFFDK